ncbi:hypothetical protein [Enterobacter asburiae]|nr:hypothetical protein [Enterobacter asburiae]MBL5836802.1 hypothetical protein [Enterobacter asburiae]MBL5937361.1 hypothetical protein [Enterobacter asburiae]MBL5962267.1 hypothetical protein [Enterobacter asburiae]MBL5968544.1 hypothetical protein [Enterobacter asburiae]
MTASTSGRSAPYTAAVKCFIIFFEFDVEYQPRRSQLQDVGLLRPATI